MDIQNFSTRVAEARAAAKFGAVVRRDQDGRPRAIVVPGHQGTQHTVLLRDLVVAGKHLRTAECFVITSGGQLPCPATGHALCYHAMAALIVAAADAGYQVKFSPTPERARKVRRFAVQASAFALRPEKGGEDVYATVFVGGVA